MPSAENRDEMKLKNAEKNRGRKIKNIWDWFKIKFWNLARILKATLSPFF